MFHMHYLFRAAIYKGSHMSTLKLHAVNSLKWSVVSLGFAVFSTLSLVVTGWILFQVLVFLMHH